MPSGPVQSPLVPCSTSEPSSAFEKALAGMALAARQVALDVQMGFISNALQALCICIS